jgi:regulator of extracellular matrix RemA (YlzA/DUF370 family)
MEMTSVLEGRYFNPKRVCCVLALDKLNYKYYLGKWKENGLAINICKAQKPRSALIFDNNLVLITSVTAETIRDRLATVGEE